MTHQCAFDLRRADAMTGNVQDVVDATHNPKISILVLAAAIAREIAAFDFPPITIFVALRIAPKAAQHPWPWFAQNQFPPGIARDSFSLVVHDFGHNPEKWQGRRAGFRGRRTGQWRDENAARLCLP